MSQPSMKRSFHVWTWLFYISGIMLFSGCSGTIETEADKLEIKSGDNQTGRLGADCSKAVVVEVLGPKHRGLFGGAGSRHPVPGVKVRFEPVDPNTGLAVTGPSEVTTDKGGYARATVALGQIFGDQYLRVFVVDDPSITETLRFIAGVEKGGDKQETVAGRTLARPLILTITDVDGQPVPGVPVHFTLVKGPGKDGKLTGVQEKTDSRGMITANIETDPGETGKYEILAEIADPASGRSVRGIKFTVMALNRTGLVIGVLGGLGIFIFGMKLMSDGLREVAGNRLRSVLHFFTRNRIVAVLAGTVMTGMIQSSSACTVMVVGFVNAGLLSLQQAIGVIFGANIGTTVTAQLISFKLGELALPAIAIGVAFFMIARRSRPRSAAQALLGFGLLFLGMDMMSAVLKGISSFPSFIKVFQTFDCQPVAGGAMPLGAVLGAVLLGTAMTVLVQSSSATIGLAIALATSGLINFYTAVPLILGDNIGTTVTALLASIGTNRPARQSAIAHTIFNVCGAVYMIALLYVPIKGVPVFLHVVNWLTAGNVFAEIPENIARHVAAAHTLFNVFNVIIFLPLLPLIAYLCRLIVPIKEGEPTITEALEPHLLNTPVIALHQSTDAMVKMVSSAWSLASDCVDKVGQPKVSDYEGLMSREQIIDQNQHDIIHYLTALTQHALNENISHAIPLMVHCVNDAERIGDHAVNLLDFARQMADEKMQFSKSANDEVGRIIRLIDEQARNVINAFGPEGEEAAARALKIEGEINQLTRDAERAHVKRLEKGKCSVAVGIVFTEVVANLERIADRLANIAERAPEIVNAQAE